MQFTDSSLQEADVIIGYSPVDNEPDYGEFLKQKGIEKHGISVLADKDISPQAFAESLTKTHSGKKVAILIPGREFDIHGTRHGRGGGWYDRFLSSVPRSWLRIGVLNVSQLSSESLERESWDEPMDALLIWEDDSWRTIQVES